MELAPRIVVDAKVCGGKPIIKGTRITVDLVMAKLVGGMTQEKMCDEYRINKEDVRAVLAYAAQRLKEDEIRAVS